MDRIYRFDEFTLILESMENNNEELLRAIEKVVPRKNFVRWVTSPYFGGVYTRPSKKYPGLEEIVYIWRNKKYEIYNIFYKDGDFYSTWEEDLSILKDPSDVKYLKGMFKSGDPSYLKDMENAFVNWLRRMYNETPIFNPFKHGIENIPIIRELESKGMKIISSPDDRKKGKLVLRFPDAVYDYVITPKGNIKRRKYGIKGPDIIVDRKELLKRIYKLEDLIPKIKFVYVLYLLDLAKSKGLSEESFEKILLALGSERGTDDPSYKEEYDKIVKEYPQIVLYLPEPKGGGDKELIKGAKILGRMGLF